MEAVTWVDPWEPPVGLIESHAGIPPAYQDAVRKDWLTEAETVSDWLAGMVPPSVAVKDRLVGLVPMYSLFHGEHRSKKVVVVVLLVVVDELELVDEVLLLDVVLPKPAR